MAAGRFTRWSVRWLPELLAFIAIYSVAVLLIDLLVWHEDAFVCFDYALNAAFFGGAAIALFWRRTASRRTSKVATATG